MRTGILLINTWPQPIKEIHSEINKPIFLVSFIRSLMQRIGGFFLLFFSVILNDLLFQEKKIILGKLIGFKLISITIKEEKNTRKLERLN